jgi:hypothetical protein
MPEAEQIDRALALDLECGGSVGGTHGCYINLLYRIGRKIYFLSSNVTREFGFFYEVLMIGPAGLRRSVRANNRFLKACRWEFFAKFPEGYLPRYCFLARRTSRQGTTAMNLSSEETEFLGAMNKIELL